MKWSGLWAMHTPWFSFRCRATECIMRFWFHQNQPILSSSVWAFWTAKSHYDYLDQNNKIDFCHFRYHWWLCILSSLCSSIQADVSMQSISLSIYKYEYYMFPGFHFLLYFLYTWQSNYWFLVSLYVLHVTLVITMRMPANLVGHYSYTILYSVHHVTYCVFAQL